MRLEALGLEVLVFLTGFVSGLLARIPTKRVRFSLNKFRDVGLISAAR